MADKFVSSSGPLGTGDGSSEANAWSLANAFSNAVAGDYVWLKNDGTYSGTYTVAASGSYTANTHIYFIGYNDIVNCDLTNHISDMDITQPYWGGPLNPSLANGWVDVDGGGAAAKLVSISYKYNLHFRNIYFHNVASGQYQVYLYYCKNNTFTKCKFEVLGTYGFYSYSSYHTSQTYCRFKGNYDCFYATHDYMTAFHNNYFDGGAGATISSGTVGNGIFAHNIVMNGLGGVYHLKTGAVFHNNIFYNQTSYCIGYGHSSLLAYFSEYNNIFMPADKSDTLINKAGNGSLVYSGYGCAWALSNGGEAMTTPYAGEYGLNVDPLLVDPVNDDFRIRNPALITGGKTDINGNPSQMGAVQRKYRFAARGRTANRARLQIIR